jgi:hypothetical protein
VKLGNFIRELVNAIVFHKNNFTKPARFPKPSRFEREIIFMNIYSCYLKRHFGIHDIYANPNNGKQAPVPRHPEIKEMLVSKIKRQLGSKIKGLTGFFGFKVYPVNL